MGNQLDKPITDKRTQLKTFNNLTVGGSCMQGWRLEMEDVTTVKHIRSDPGCSLLAVYDGHGGSLIATLASQAVEEELCAKLCEHKDLSPETLTALLHDMFIRIDNTLRTTSGFDKSTDSSGSTAVLCLITESHIILANLGDSRAVICTGGRAIPLSEDHKPSNSGERARIEAADCQVLMGRVNGNLALSRAFGDFEYKQRDDLAPEEQAVSSAPEISVHARSEADEFIVLACDGIWDVMSNDAVCKLVREALDGGEGDPSVICEELLDTCLDLDSRDNMSALLCLFPGLVLGKGEGLGPKRRERLERAEALAQAEEDDEAVPVPDDATDFL
eukprot:c52836_g1_i1.p1 GENE.c52836_g1_i1~~c52836_g1_i1.p1  ORF type:complete len:332 (-),score=71.16 c52836_g1_i1:139-1134(-)